MTYFTSIEELEAWEEKSLELSNSDQLEIERIAKLLKEGK